MPKLSDSSLLKKYCVPPMGNYSEPGSHLCEILRRLDKNNSLSDEDKNWIKSKGMFQLYSFVVSWEKTGRPNFKPLQGRNRKRETLNEIKRLNKKYGIWIRRPGSVLHKVIKRIDKGERFSKQDVVWLHEKGFLEDILRIEFHRREAEFYQKKYFSVKNLWDLVNASSHLRKSRQSHRALEITSDVKINKVNNRKLKSALSVTRGGAYRDLKEFHDALKQAQEAYASDPSSFHPCTLYGAVYYEMGKLNLGEKWFRKAVEKGADEDHVDSLIRSIYKQSKGAEQKIMKMHLLERDPIRYSWVQNLKK